MTQEDTGVIIIGGGVQGICLLNALQQHQIPSVVITENTLGDGQSIQNHGYFHNGYIFASNKPHNLSASWPANLIDQIRQNHPIYFAGPSKFIQMFSANWDQNHMPWKRVSTPSQFLAGAAGKMDFVQIADFTFNKKTLIRNLAKPVQDKIYTGHVMSYQKNADNKWRVSVSPPNPMQEPTVLNASAIAFCAGTANFSFAKQASDESQNTSNEQSGVKTWNAENLHMLCVKGPNSILPCESLICWPLQFMIAAQPAEDNQTLYYISIFNELQMAQVSNGEPDLPGSAVGEVSPAVVRAAVELFFVVLPQAKEQAHLLNWFAFSGWKVAHPLKPLEHWVPYCKNLFDGDESAVVVNPTIISNIFVNSTNVVDLFSKLDYSGVVTNRVVSLPVQNEVSMSPEEIHGWQSYQDFCNQFLLSPAFAHM